MREQVAITPSIFNSRMVKRSEVFDAIATGPGRAANIPFWKDMSVEDGEEVQIEDTAPATNSLGTDVMVVPPLNRVKKWGSTAIAAQIVGEDPVTEIITQLSVWRLKARQRTLLAMLRGVMGTGVQTPGQAQGCLRANRRDIFIENGAAATAANLIDADDFIDTIGLMGEQAETLENGAIFMHSAIKTALEKIDASSFKNGVQSELRFAIRTYRGIPLFVSDALRRPGATSGFVYDTYIAANASIAYGEKPQVADTGTTVDVAALQFDVDKDKNNAFLYDRTRFVMGATGCRWTGTPAGSSASNAELQTHSNWSYLFNAPSLAGIVAIRTNG